jgi:hypothetical protein
MDIIEVMGQFFSSLLGLLNPMGCAPATAKTPKSPAEVETPSDSYTAEPSCRETQNTLLLNFSNMESTVRFFTDKCNEFCTKNSKSYNQARCKCFDAVHATSQDPLSHYSTCLREQGYDVEKDPSW